MLAVTGTVRNGSGRARLTLFVALHFGRNWHLATVRSVAIAVANGGKADIKNFQAQGAARMRPAARFDCHLLLADAGQAPDRSSVGGDIVVEVGFDDAAREDLKAEGVSR